MCRGECGGSVDTPLSVEVIVKEFGLVGIPLSVEVIVGVLALSFIPLL